MIKTINRHSSNFVTLGICWFCWHWACLDRSSTLCCGTLCCGEWHFFGCARCAFWGFLITIICAITHRVAPGYSRHCVAPDADVSQCVWGRHSFDRYDVLDSMKQKKNWMGCTLGKNWVRHFWQFGRPCITSENGRQLLKIKIRTQLHMKDTHKFSVIFKQILISCVYILPADYLMCKYFDSYLVLGVIFCQATEHVCVFLTWWILESVYFTRIIIKRVLFQQRKNYNWYLDRYCFLLWYVNGHKIKMCRFWIILLWCVYFDR